MDPGVCREHLQKLLAEEFNALTQLETLLDHEHELLVANDVDGLDRAGETRQVCVGALLRVEDERRSLCRMMNVPTDVQGLERLLRWCDPSNTMQRRLGECAAARDPLPRAQRPQRRAGYGALEEGRGMLDVLTGRANQPKVYGRQGMFQQPRANARVLASV